MKIVLALSFFIIPSSAPDRIGLEFDSWKQSSLYLYFKRIKYHLNTRIIHFFFFVQFI